MTIQERYNKIRSLMVERGIKNVDIARQAEISRIYLYKVMKGKEPGYRVRLVIAQACHVPVETIFPDTPPQYRRAA